MSVDLIIEGPVAKVVLNRPEKLNALTHEMRAQLRDYTQQLRFDENVRAIIVTGEGRAFCTGADVGRMQRGGLRAERERMQGGSHQFLRTLHATEKPVIAAVRGPTVGIGWSIALACDLIVASETARFSQVFRRIGLAPDGGAIWFLTRRIGLARAKELVFTARFVEAQEALSLGPGEPRRAGRRADGEDRGTGGGSRQRARLSHSAWRRSCSTWRAGRATRTSSTTRRSCSRSSTRPRTTAKASRHSGRSGKPNFVGR